MELVVDTSLPARVIVGATGITQLAQEIRTVLTTRRGSVPLDRDFGISWDLIDQPTPAARQLLIAEVARQLERYVPRIRFRAIEFPDPGTVASMEGVVHFKVRVEIREEYLSDFA